MLNTMLILLKKDPKFKVGDHVNIFGLTNLLLAKLKIQFHRHVISDLNGEKIDGAFYKKRIAKD